MRRLAVIFLFFVLAILSFYSYRNYYGRPIETPEPNQKRNVYVITASGLRASHLSSYLYQSIQTPAIDFLAYDGIRFTNAFTNSTESLIAHLSLLTGNYPNHDSVKQTYEYLVDLAKHGPKRLTILPEILARQGYRTAAFLSDPELRYPSFFATLFHQAFTGDHILYPWQAGYSAATTCKLAREWVRENREIPHFLLVNFDEPTYPFQPPTPYNKQYEKYPYDGEIAGLDEQIGLFVNLLKETGLFQRSIIVFASPYGESLEGESRYSTPKNNVLQVPLMITAPGLLPRHENYEGQVSLVDVVPTILKLLEIPTENKFDGSPLFEKGRNNQVSHPFILGIVPYAKLAGFAPEYYVRGNSYLYVSGVNETATRHDAFEVTDPQRNTWIQEGRKLIHEAGWKNAPAPPETFETDPGLLLERAMQLAREERPEIALDLLESFFENVPQNSYLKTLLGSLAAASQDTAKGLEFMNQAAAISPTGRCLPVLARLQLSANLPEEAFDTLKKYKRETPLSYDVRSTYALTLSLLGRNQEALLEFDTVLRQNPRYSEAYLYRGKLWKKLGRLSEAEADWKSAIEADWNNLAAYHELASLFQERGRPADAIPYLRQLLHFEPQNYEIMLQLATLHEQSGNQTEARKLCEQVILKSEDPDLKERAKKLISSQ